MLNRGFGTSLFNMLPKDASITLGYVIGFETNLFNILSKGTDFSNP